MALTLLTLPNDILMDVLDVLEPIDLYNLALVSSRMTDLAQRVLYRSVHLNIKYVSEQDRPPVDPGNTFTRLVNTLSQKPHLRLCVSALSIKSWSSPFASRLKDLENLLVPTPGLRSLSLDPPPVHYQLSNASLPLLETLGLDFSNANYSSLRNEWQENPIKSIARQFWAPSLRRLYIESIVFHPEMSVLFPSDRHRTASITDLRFQDCDESVLGCLPDIILCVKALERFTLEVMTPWEGSDYSTSEMAPETIGQFICIHASTLVELVIAGSDAAEFPSTSLIGSLAGYRKVERLAIPEPFLVVVEDEASTLVDVLPPNLEELQLQFPMLKMQGKDKDRASRIKRLEQVAAAKHVRFPALRRVVWWAQPAECWDNDAERYGPTSDMHHLAATFIEVGVKFEWCSTAYFRDSSFGLEHRVNPWGNEYDY